VNLLNGVKHLVQAPIFVYFWVIKEIMLSCHSWNMLHLLLFATLQRACI